MTTQTFVLALAASCALLALWVEVRFPKLAPEGLLRIFANMLVAVVGMHVAAHLVTVGADEPLTRFASVFALALPALTYVFLSTIWVLRLIQTSLQGSVR
jgi:hypothetical protein